MGGCTGEQACQCSTWCENTPSATWSSIPDCCGCSGSGNAQTANSNAESSERGQEMRTRGGSDGQSQQYAHNGQLSSAEHSMAGVSRFVVFGVAAAVGLRR